MPSKRRTRHRAARSSLVCAVTTRWDIFSRLLKKTHMLRCARSPRVNVLPMYASARRFFARLASEIFLSSLQSKFFRTLSGRFHAALILFFLVLVHGTAIAKGAPEVSVQYALTSPLFEGV